MKQIMQDLEQGGSFIVEAPAPRVRDNCLLIDTVTTLISSGTERMLVDFGKANLIDKARQQPEKVKMVLEKVQTDGLLTTIDAVRAKLSQPLPLGYCHVGTVAETGDGVEGFNAGDRVASNGPHADVVCVGKQLCAKIPDTVADDEAAFTVVASIGLQGIRLAQPTLGESFVVTGVGLIGLLTVQLLRAQGCRVLAIDFDDNKLSLAQSFGAAICNPGKGQDPVACGMAFSRGWGVDGVLVTASTQSNDPVSQAARMSRKRGRIVLVGVAGLELKRADFYEKELSFQVSCSYGPGRYDPAYEEQGHDYPLGFVRWTEQRNFQAILDMLAEGTLDVKPLITHRFAFEDATDAYGVLSQDHSALGILLEYHSPVAARHAVSVMLNKASADRPGQTAEPVVGFIGAGNYASRVLIPAFKQSGAHLQTVVTSGGLNGAIQGKKAGFVEATTDSSGLLANKRINTLVVATRHNTHASLVQEALAAGKHVFVEKPLAITQSELDSVKSVYRQTRQDSSRPLLMVGFNRRFSPHMQKIKRLLATLNEPKTLIMTMNAGPIAADHWTQDKNIGGGRIIGEACHYIDLMRYLVGHTIVSVQARRMGDSPALPVVDDKAAIMLGFADGSFGTIHYLANGANRYPKETIEVFAGGRVLRMENFIKLKGYGWPGLKTDRLWRQDKGQRQCVAAFLTAIRQGSTSPIASDEIFEVAAVTIEVAEILRTQ